MRPVPRGLSAHGSRRPAVAPSCVLARKQHCKQAYSIRHSQIAENDRCGALLLDIIGNAHIGVVAAAKPLPSSPHSFLFFAAMPLLNVLLPIAGAALLCALWKVVQQYISWYNSSLRYMPGPRCNNWLRGNLPEMRAEEPCVVQQRWAERYGHVFHYKVSLNVRLSLLPHASWSMGRWLIIF